MYQILTRAQHGIADRLFRISTVIFLTLFSVLLLSGRDMWDGTITSFAAERSEYLGIGRLTSDTNLHTVYYLFRLEILISHLFKVSFLFVDRIFVAASLFVVAHFISKILKERFQLSSSVGELASSLFLTFPIWHVLTSTTQTFYMIFMTMGVVGISLYYSKRKTSRIIGLILLIGSFEMNSMLLFAPALAFLYEATYDVETNFKNRLMRPGSILAVAVAYWFVSRKISTPSGQYVGYNEIINPFTISGWNEIKSGFANYSTFLILPMVSISIIGLLALGFGRQQKQPECTSNGKILETFTIVPLILASIFPYILVTKSTQVDDFDWLGRHAVLLSIPISLGTALIVKSVLHLRFTHVFGEKILRVVVFGILLFPQVIILANGLNAKITRQLIDAELSESIQGLDIPNGLVEIVGLPALVPDHRVYESNYLFWKTFGSTNWWTRIAPTTDVDFSIPTWIGDRSYQQMYIYSPTEEVCRTLITASLSQKQGISPRLKTLLSINPGISVKIESVESKCA